MNNPGFAQAAAVGRELSRVLAKGADRMTPTPAALRAAERLLSEAIHEPLRREMRDGMASAIDDATGLPGLIAALKHIAKYEPCKAKAFCRCASCGLIRTARAALATTEKGETT